MGGCTIDTVDDEGDQKDERHYRQDKVPERVRARDQGVHIFSFGLGYLCKVACILGKASVIFFQKKVLDDLHNRCY